MVRAMCGVQLLDIKRAKDLMLGLNETADQLAMTVLLWPWLEEGGWSYHEKGGGHVLRASNFEVKGQRKKSGSKRT